MSDTEQEYWQMQREVDALRGEVARLRNKLRTLQRAATPNDAGPMYIELEGDVAAALWDDSALRLSQPEQPDEGVEEGKP